MTVTPVPHKHKRTPVSYKNPPPMRQPVGPLQRSFLQFHRANPWVYDRLVEISKDLLAKGFGKYSMRTLIAVLRFEWDLKTSGQNVSIGSGQTVKVKLNNNHSPYYARMLMQQHPQFKGFFDMRRAEGE